MLHEIWLTKKASNSTTLDDPLVVMPEDKHDYDLKTCATYPPIISRQLTPP